MLKSGIPGGLLKSGIPKGLPGFGALHADLPVGVALTSKLLDHRVGGLFGYVEEAVARPDLDAGHLIPIDPRFRGQEIAKVPGAQALVPAKVDEQSSPGSVARIVVVRAGVDQFPALDVAIGRGEGAFFRVPSPPRGLRLWRGRFWAVAGRPEPRNRLWRSWLCRMFRIDSRRSVIRPCRRRRRKRRPSLLFR